MQPPQQFYGFHHWQLVVLVPNTTQQLPGCSFQPLPGFFPGTKHPFKSGQWATK